jgi:uncharacterized coiled-coil protein SlyX
MSETPAKPKAIEDLERRIRELEWRLAAAEAEIRDLKGR